MHLLSSWPLCTWSAHGAPPPHHHGVLPRRHSSAVWRRTFKTRHGRKLLPSDGAREGMAASGATGLPTAWKRTESPAAPRRCLCRREARGCRWPGSASSKGTTASSTSRGLRASLSAAITTAQSRSNGRERPKGGRYFICRPPRTVDEIPSTLRSDPADVIGDTAAPPYRPGLRRPVSRVQNCLRRVPACRGHASVAVLTAWMPSRRRAQLDGRTTAALGVHRCVRLAACLPEADGKSPRLLPCCDFH